MAEPSARPAYSEDTVAAVMQHICSDERFALAAFPSEAHAATPPLVLPDEDDIANGMDATLKDAVVASDLQLAPPVSCFVRTTTSVTCTAEDPVSVLLDSETIPQHLWPAALPLATFIARNPRLFTGRRVLEIGSGAGLAGLVAARAAASVLLTDCSPVSVAMLRTSLAKGGVINAAAAPLTWNDEASIAAAQSAAQQLHAATPTSECDEGAATALDTVIGSDVFYFNSSLRAGLLTVRRLLPPGGVFWCGSFVRSDRMESDLETMPAALGFTGGLIGEQPESAFRLFRWVAV